MPHTLAALTYEEREMLERRYDGPIPPQAIEDVIAKRGPSKPKSREEIQAEIKALLEIAAERVAYRDSLPLTKQVSRDLQTQLIAEAMEKASQLDDELEAMSMPAAAE